MIRSLRRLVIASGYGALVFFVCVTCFAASDTSPAAGDSELVARAPAASWIEELPWSVPSGAGTPGVPAEIVLSDQQCRLSLEDSDYFAHTVVRLLNNQGVRQNAEWSIVFSPDHEQVTWHTLKIFRGGDVIDRLPTVRFKKLQRELQLEQQVFDGRSTVVAILDDVRVGDVVEVAYTLHNANPLLHGRLNAHAYLGAGYPIQRQRIVVRTPASEPEPAFTFLLPPGTRGLPDALFRPAALRLALENEMAGDERILRWEGRSLAALTFDANIPGAASPYYPLLRVSSFKTWAGVAEWATEIFSRETQLPPEAQALVAEWRKKYSEPADRLAAAVHWVQDDVRYFAMAVGEHNLRPRPLIEVCATRFGDCKDKSVLLAALLRELGFEAWPALVNARAGGRLRDQSPSPFAFDHAIVAYRFGDRLRWVDATLKGQQGPPGEWETPRYGCGLVLRPETTDLETIPDPARLTPDTETTDIVTIDPQSGDATLHTRTVLRGLQADLYRQHLESSEASELSRRWFNFISRFYKQLDEVEPPIAADDPAHNEISVVATYRIPEFIRTEREERFIALYSYALRAALDPPESRRRRWPYALTGGRHLQHRMECIVPAALPLQQHPEAIVAPGVEYRIEQGMQGNRVVVLRDLRFTRDYVAADQMDTFCDAIDEILTTFSTVVTLPKPGATASPPEVPLATTAAR